MPVPGSAVADAYARLAEVLPALAVTELGTGEAAPTGGGWVAASGLAEGGSEQERFLAWDDTQVLRDYGQRGRPDVIASFGLHRYAWPACLLITVPWFLHRRVPYYPVTHVSFDRTAAGCPRAALGHLLFCHLRNLAGSDVRSVGASFMGAHKGRPYTRTPEHLTLIARSGIVPPQVASVKRGRSRTLPGEEVGVPFVLGVRRWALGVGR